MTEYKPFLDELFSDAELVMWELSEPKGYFTQHEFYTEGSKRHLYAYMQLVHSGIGRETPQGSEAFVSELLDSHLLSAAERAGYIFDGDSDLMETDRGGRRIKARVFRRGESVRQSRE